MFNHLIQGLSQRLFDFFGVMMMTCVRSLGLKHLADEKKDLFQRADFFERVLEEPEVAQALREQARALSFSEPVGDLDNSMLAFVPTEQSPSSPLPTPSTNNKPQGGDDSVPALPSAEQGAPIRKRGRPKRAQSTTVQTD